MGPLISNNIISGDLNLIFALVAGIGFGYLLEQAGFSSSRKLAGVFYGYDFVVLKVFFTAAITSAVGLFYFRYLGWIDFNLVYINPLYLQSAIVGGVIMGFGFILGGFCPGTGLAAAAIGKMDAMLFVAGMFLGIFLFGIAYPIFEPIHTGSFFGNVLIHHSLGMSQSLFLLLLVLVALMAFYVTQQIENRSSKFKELLNAPRLEVKYPLAFLLILSFTAVLLPENRRSFSRELPAAALAGELVNGQHQVSVLRVAHSLVHHLGDLHLVDVRSPDEYRQYHLPGAINIPLDNILSRHLHPLLSQKNKTTVLYSNGSTKADMAWLALQRRGMDNVFTLEGGLNNFFATIFIEENDTLNSDVAMQSKQRFLRNAAIFFKEGELLKRAGQDKSLPKPPEIELKAAQGGC